MKLLIVLAALFGLALSKPIDDSQNAQILRYENDNTPTGYKFAYETSNGIRRTEQAELKNIGTELETLVVRGTISWIAPDGQEYSISFLSDENGFQPEGAHLPK